MGTVNVTKNTQEQSVTLYDEFYNKTTAISQNEYEVVRTFFKSYGYDNEIADDFTAVFFQILDAYNITQDELLKEFKVAVLPGTSFADTAETSWANTASTKWANTPATISVTIDAKTTQEIYMIQKRLDLLLDNFQSIENQLAQLEEREPIEMRVEFVPPELRR